MLELTRTGKMAVLSVAVPTTAVLFYILYRSWFEDEDDNEVESSLKNVTTERQTTIELKIPHKDVGMVIGRQGHNIKEIQEKSGARVNFNDNPKGEEEDRTLLIRGTPETAQTAECLVRKFLADIPVVVQEDMFAPGYALGRIIGKNGDRIRQLSRGSNTKIYVDRTKAEYPDEPRLITINGTKEKIVIAKGMIQEIIEEEDQFRAKAAVNAANRETRSKTKNISDLNSHENGSGDSSAVSSKLGPGSESPAATSPSIVIATISWPSEKDYIEVYVSAVAHPGHFWVQLISTSSLKLDESSVAMTRYYTEEPGKNLQLSAVNEGDYVAAPFEVDGAWYRAQVMGFEGTKADLLYVDYGDSDFIEVSTLKPLSEEFISLPIQAVECRLSGVKPSGDTWTDTAIERFEELTYCSKWKVMMVRTDSYDGTFPRLTLFDTNTEQDININEVLVQEGFAVHC